MEQFSEAGVEAGKAETPRRRNRPWTGKVARGLVGKGLESSCGY